MKAAIVTQAMRTSTGTQDWTDAIFSSDVKAAIFFGSRADTNATNTTQAELFLGCTDLTRNVVITLDEQDATAAPSDFNYIDATHCIAKTTTGTLIASASYTSTLATGVRVTYDAASATAYVANCLLLGGSDIEVAVSSAAFATTDTSKTITHNLTGTPEILIVVLAGQVAALGNGSTLSPVIGFWDGTNSVGVGFSQTFGSNPTQVSARINSDLGHQVLQDIDRYTLSVSSVGATTLALNRTATATQVACVYVIAIRHLSNTLAAKASLSTLPTSTGNAALVTGMAVKPQVLISIPTRLTATTLATDDSTGSLGIGIAVNNNGVTQRAASAITVKDNVATSVARSQSANNAALISLDNTGALVNSADITSWDSGGVTLNHTAVGASAFEMISLAFGIQSAARVPSMTLLGVG